MNIESITVRGDALRKLFSMGSGEAALLYLYTEAGNPANKAEEELHLSPAQLRCAQATLRQLGLWREETRATFQPGERPGYNEQDVRQAHENDGDFRSLCGEVQRMLGKPLNTEELKILLGFTRYLGLPNEVIAMLVCYCRERSRQKGSLRNPSLRTIEKEAYAWAEQGIDSLEAAAAYIRNQNLVNSGIERLKRQLQIHGRGLTPGEERYARSWLDMGFDEQVIAMAYERTCLNTGGLSWAYMNKILTRWHEAGLHTAEAVKNGDRKPAAPKGASGELGAAELEAIARMMKEN